MFEPIKLHKFEHYIFVETYTRDDIFDISVFTDREWADLLQISSKFEDCARGLNSSSDYGYSSANAEYRSASYYLHYSTYTTFHYGFSSLDYYTGTKKFLYKLVFKNVESNPDQKITINKFRKWLHEDYDNIYAKYLILIK